MQHSIMIEGRKFRLGCFQSGRNDLYRFPLVGGQGLYVPLCDFESILSLVPLESEEDPSVMLCLVNFDDDGWEMTFDCSPDQLVELIKLYRDVAFVRKTIADVFDR